MGNNNLREVIQICRDTDIVELARSLDLPLRKTGSTYVSLCPFHSDSKPSLHFYRKNNQFHCFSCAAHGDTIALVKQIKGVDFVEALRWIYAVKGQVWPEHHSVKKINGWSEAERVFQRQREKNNKAFTQFAETRNFELDFLKKAGVGFSSPACLHSAVKESKEGRVLLDSFLELGLLRNKYPTVNSAQSVLNLDWVSDYFYEKRIIFPIEDSKGFTVGFAGRTLDEQKLKYLYTKGLKKSETLYRYVAAKTLLQTQKSSGKKTLDLYIVEGVLDALRLESLGFPAVALLGSHPSEQQIKLIMELTALVEKQNQMLRLSLFLDADDAGRKGAKRFIADVVKIAITGDCQFLLNIVVPMKDGKEIYGTDPDDFLRETDNYNKACIHLESSTISVIDFLTSNIQCCSIADLPEVWGNYLSPVDQTLVLRRIEDVFKGVSRMRVAIERFHLGSPNNPPWQQRLINRSLRGTVKDPQDSTRTTRPEYGEFEKLKHALAIARTSSQRREMPSDSNGWRQIDMAADVFFPYFEKLLKNGEGAKIGLPMMAYPVPKMNGEYRLKAVPCNEVLLLQQYLLNQILTPRVDFPELASFIPAVRKWSGAPVETTGIHSPSETVSFAYQIDMDVLEGRTRISERSGMFVPYLRCWYDFVRKIDQYVTEISRNNENVFMVRLDIKRYYDNVNRQLVNDVLREPLRKVFSAIDSGKDPIAYLFLPEASPDQRADSLLDWLCDSSFGYRYESYKDGKPEDYNSSVGLPQGPDLSAYLANVAIFPLDRFIYDKARSLNNEDVFAIGYARYVDDLVLVASSRKVLVNFTQTIEHKLQEMGLELNRKHQDLPPMDEEEARAWVTDQRGGLGSSVLGELPFVGQTQSASVLFDASEPIGRREALARLANPELFEAGISFDGAKEELDVITSAEDLRFGEIIRACVLIWWVALQEENEEDPFARFQKYFEEVFSENKSLFGSADSKLYKNDVRILAALESLERFLTNRRDRMPTQNEETKEKLRAIKVMLAKKIVCEGVPAFWHQKDVKEESEVLHAIRLRKLTILNIAQVLIGGSIQTKIDFLRNGNSTWFKRQLCHLLSTGNDLISASGQEADDPLLMLHEGIARLRNKPLNDIDPLSPLEERVKRISGGSDADTWLGYVLKAWVHNDPADVSISVDSKKLQLCLNSFINCCVNNKELSALLLKRSSLLKAIADNNVEKDDFLPIPPGVHYPGLIWKSENDGKIELHRRDFADNADIVYADKWKQIENSDIWVFTPDLADFSFEEKRNSLENMTPKDCINAVNLFREIYAFIKNNSDTEYTILPVVGNVCELGGKKRIITYKLARENVGTGAFIAPLEGITLLSREVPEIYSDLWRVGVVVSDFFGFGTEYFNDDDFRLNLKTISGNSDWAAETMLRIAFSRLTGRTSFTLRQSLDIGSDDMPFPALVAQMLKNMEKFGESDGDKIRQIEILYSVLFDMRASALRNNVDFESLDAPGTYAQWLAHLAMIFFKHDEILDEKLPVLPERHGTSGSTLPIISRGWNNLACRIEKLSDSVDDLPNELQLLAAGCRLLSVKHFSQNLAIALVAKITPENQQEILERVKSSSTIDPNFDFSKLQISLTEETGTLSRVLSALFAEGDNQNLPVVTPAGWFAIVCLLGGILGDLPGTASCEKPDEKMLQDIVKSCCLTLEILSSIIIGDEYPYRSIGKAVEKFDNSNMKDVLNVLSKISAYFGIFFVKGKSAYFSLPGGKKKHVRVQLGAREITLKQTSILVQRLKGESSQTPLASDGVDGDNNHIRLWQEIRVHESIVGITVWSTPFAKFAGLSSRASENLKNSDLSIKENFEKNIGSDSVQGRKNVFVPNEAQMTPKVVEKNEVNSVDSESDDCMTEFVNIQKSLWQKRGLKSSKSHLRVALLQMRVKKESYSHPVLEDVTIKKENWTSVIAEEKGFVVESKEELRRRKIIEKTLDACVDFGVDVLVLPEYSTRPETVLFMRDYISRKPSRLAIWAGTCRIPPKYNPMKKNEFSGLFPWVSVLPVVHWTKGGYEICTKRFKRYGSIAANEWFNPLGNESLIPVSDILEWNPKNDLKSYCTELICSEIFLANPGNLPSLAEYRKKMLNQLNNRTEIEPKKMVFEDLTAFSKSISLTRSLDTDIHRKSVILIPAFTTRAVDFAVFGQASYLSAGVVSVLCNAVADTNSIGRSCFIGDNCWDSEEAQECYKQRMGPYHGVFPGIYRQSDDENSDGRGALGKEDQAVVIVDIDPINTIPGKPKQQTLLSPMELVAHLPIIECMNDNDKKKKDINKLIENILRVNKEETKNPLNAIEQVLNKLSELDNVTNRKKANASWLKRRYDSFRANHFQLPSLNFLPSLIDWIHVIIDKNATEEIYAPEFKEFG